MAKIHKVVFDTNIWLDVLLKRPDFYAYSYGAMLACVEDEIQISIVSTSLKDIFYLVSKAAGSAAGSVADFAAGYEALNMIFSIATVLTVDDAVCKAAMQYEIPDYEDGIVLACALADGIDAIVTRDAAAFSRGATIAKDAAPKDAAAFCDCSMDRFTPMEFLRQLGYSEQVDLQSGLPVEGNMR